MYNISELSPVTFLPPIFSKEVQKNFCKASAPAVTVNISPPITPPYCFSHFTQLHTLHLWQKTNYSPETWQLPISELPLIFIAQSFPRGNVPVVPARCSDSLSNAHVYNNVESLLSYTTISCKMVPMYI